MKPFMDKDFLLSTDTARTLFHEIAEKMPVLDYHCHINPQEIAEDRKFENITQVWLGGDHYKWRQMRSNGVEEYYITGNAPRQGKIPEMGGDAGEGNRQSPVSLEPSGAAALFRLLWRFKRRYGTGGMGSLQCKASGGQHERPQPYQAVCRNTDLYHG